MKIIQKIELPAYFNKAGYYYWKNFYILWRFFERADTWTVSHVQNPCNSLEYTSLLRTKGSVVVVKQTDWDTPQK